LFKSKEEYREAKIIISAGDIMPKPNPIFHPNIATDVNYSQKIIVEDL
jgi:hypothetical protein